MNVVNSLPPSVIACLENAKELLESSKHLYERKFINPAFNAALSCIEETGKACLIQIGAFNGRSQSWVKKRRDDHQEKLFHAFLMNLYINDAISKENIEGTRDLSVSLHDLNLKGKYVDEDRGQRFLIPAQKVGEIIKLAELGLSIFPTQPPSEENCQLINKFLTLVTEKREWVFCKNSLDKLSELKNNFPEWAKWLMSEEINEEKNRSELLQKELNRSLPEEGTPLSPKWKFKVRVQSSSHSVRQAELDEWNKQSKWIQIFPVDSKNGKKELIFDFYLPESVHIQNLPTVGYTFMRSLILAINIASKGFFWWYSLNTKTWYESIEDLESKRPLKFDLPSDPLEMEWPNLVLSSSDLRKTEILFSRIPTSIASLEDQEPFEAYFNGLAFLAKGDVHLGLLPNACEQFFHSLETGMKLYGDYKAPSTFSLAFKKFFKNHLTPKDGLELELERISKLVHKFETPHDSDFSDLTFDRVMQVKVFCDIYFDIKLTQLKLED